MSALIMEKCVFLHAPKTGGTWALAALRAQGIVQATINAPDGSTHPYLSTVRSVTKLPAISTVREPVSWLRSFWRFFHARAWRDSNPPHDSFAPLLSMATDTFQEFAQRYTHRRGGYVSELLARYTDGAEFVCRQESLAADLQSAFSAIGQVHVPGVFAKMPPKNVSRQFSAACTEDVSNAIRKADSWLIERWYRDAA